MANYKVPIKGGGTIVVESLNVFPDQVFAVIAVNGLKDLFNRGMTKIGPLKVDAAKGHTEADVAASAAKAMEIAQKNFDNLKEGKLPRMAGVKASDSKVPGVVMTEARRLAKNLIKDEIKKSGGKISHFEPKDITAAANAYLASDEGKEQLTMAQANVDARSKMVEEKPVTSLADLQAKLGISVSDTKVKAAEAKKAKAKAAGTDVLSAAAAGKVKQRTGKPEQATAH